MGSASRSRPCDKKTYYAIYYVLYAVTSSLEASGHSDVFGTGAHQRAPGVGVRAMQGRDVGHVDPGPPRSLETNGENEGHAVRRELC